MGEPLGERTPSMGAFRVERFGPEAPVGGFSCGDEALDYFLTAGEALDFEREDLGRTYLAFLGSELVGYFTLSVAEVRIEYLEAWPPAGRMAAKGMEAVPAVKVGRLAVDVRAQGRGIGGVLVREVGALAVIASRAMGVRLLVVQAKPRSVGFYERFGVQRAAETRRERGRRNRTMFVDLRQVAGRG